MEASTAEILDSPILSEVRDPYPMFAEMRRNQPVFAAEVRRHPHRAEVRRPGPGPHLDQLRRAVQPDHPHGVAPVHAPDQCLQQEVREPRARGRAAPHALQFLPYSPNVALTPAMEAGVSDHVWSLGEVIALLG